MVTPKPGFPMESSYHWGIAEDLGRTELAVLLKHVCPDLDAASMGRMVAGRTLENGLVQLVRASGGQSD